MLQPRYAFMVRIWQEGQAWRGSLEATGSGEAAYFASLERLAELLSQTTGWSGELEEPDGRGSGMLEGPQDGRKE